MEDVIIKDKTIEILSRTKYKILMLSRAFSSVIGPFIMDRDDILNRILIIDLSNKINIDDVLETLDLDDNIKDMKEVLIGKNISLYDKLKLIIPPELIVGLESKPKDIDLESHDAIKKFYMFVYTILLHNKLFDEVYKELDYLNIDHRSEMVVNLFYAKIRNEDVEKFYKIMIKVFREEYEKLIDKDNEDVIDVFVDIFTFIFPFFFDGDYDKINSIVLDIINTTDSNKVLECLRKNFFNRKYFEEYINKNSEKSNFEDCLSLFIIFILIKMSLLTDDLNKDPKYYLDKLIETLENRLGNKELFIYLISLIFKTTIISHINEGLVFMAILINNLLTPSFLELIKYYSFKKNKNPKKVLNEIFNYFKEVFRNVFHIDENTNIDDFFEICYGVFLSLIINKSKEKRTIDKFFNFNNNIFNLEEPINIDNPYDLSNINGIEINKAPKFPYSKSAVSVFEKLYNTLNQFELTIIILSTVRFLKKYFNMDKNPEIFIAFLLVTISNKSNINEMIEYLKNIELGYESWCKCKDVLNNTNVLEKIKNIINKNTSFLTKVKSVLKEFYSNELDELNSEFMVTKTYLIEDISLPLFISGFESKILLELQKQINYLTIDSYGFIRFFDTIKNKDIDKLYLIIFNEISKEVRLQQNENIDIEYTRKVVLLIINKIFPFFSNINSLFELLIDNKNIYSILNKLYNDFLNKEQFEKYIDYLLESDDIPDITYIFHSIKMLKLVDDLNEHPKYYLDKIIKLLFKKLKTKKYMIYLRNTDEPSDKVIVFISTFIEYLMNPWILELIKYCSQKEKKNVDDILKEIFKDFEKEFSNIELLRDYNMPQLLRNSFKMILQEDIMRKEIEKITLEDNTKVLVH